MSRRRSNKRRKNNGEGGHLPTLLDPVLLSALGHVLRQHIMLAAIQQGEVSPAGLARAFEEPVSQVSYHVGVLSQEGVGLLELTRTEPRRGAVEHFYRANVETLMPAGTWRGLETGMRTVVGAGQASDLFDDLAEAMKDGKLRGDQDYISRTPLVLDEKGARNLSAIARRAMSEATAEQRAATKRMTKENGTGYQAIGFVFSVLNFEAAWKPAGSLSGTRRSQEMSGDDGHSS